MHCAKFANERITHTYIKFIESYFECYKKSYLFTKYLFKIDGFILVVLVVSETALHA